MTFTDEDAGRLFAQDMKSFLMVFLFCLGFWGVLFVPTFLYTFPHAFYLGMGPWGLSYRWLGVMSSVFMVPILFSFLYLEDTYGKELSRRNPTRPKGPTLSRPGVVLVFGTAALFAITLVVIAQPIL